MTSLTPQNISGDEDERYTEDDDVKSANGEDKRIETQIAREDDTVHSNTADKIPVPLDREEIRKILADPRCSLLHGWPYERLDMSQRSIRLLKVFSQPPTPMIVAALGEFNLDSVPPYQTLSYTWDTPISNTNYIFCNGHPLGVGRNVWEFLYRYQQELDSKDGLSTPWIWIDAICIDQTNISERNHQVQLMKEIYSNTQKTIVWLGNEAEIVTACEILDSFHRSAPTAWFAEIIPESVCNAAEILNARPRYWKRMWIMQEFLLGPDLCIWSGAVELPWILLLQMFRAVYLITSISDEILPSITLLHERYRRGQPEHLKGNQHYTFEQLSYVYKDSQCAVMHDKVYALLAIATDSSGRPYSLDVDYSKSLMDVFLDVTRCICRWDESIDRRENDSIMCLFINIFGLSGFDAMRRAINMLGIGKLDLLLDTADHHTGSAWNRIRHMIEPIVCLENRTELSELPFAQI